MPYISMNMWYTRGQHKKGKGGTDLRTHALRLRLAGEVKFGWRASRSARCKGAGEKQAGDRNSSQNKKLRH